MWPFKIYKCKVCKDSGWIVNAKSRDYTCAHCTRGLAAAWDLNYLKKVIKEVHSECTCKAKD